MKDYVETVTILQTAARIRNHLLKSHSFSVQIDCNKIAINLAKHKKSYRFSLISLIEKEKNDLIFWNSHAAHVLFINCLTETSL